MLASNNQRENYCNERINYQLSIGESIRDNDPKRVIPGLKVIATSETNFDPTTLTSLLYNTTRYWIENQRFLLRAPFCLGNCRQDTMMCLTISGVSL